MGRDDEPKEMTESKSHSIAGVVFVLATVIVMIVAVLLLTVHTASKDGDIARGDDLFDHIRRPASRPSTAFPAATATVQAPNIAVARAETAMNVAALFDISKAVNS